MPTTTDDRRMTRLRDLSCLIADELGLAPPRVAATIAAGHHERWDGAGFPRGLAGAAIPLAARIVAVADVFTALTSPCGYRPGRSLEEGRRHLLAQRGRQFDPDCVDAMLARWPEAAAIARDAPAGRTPARPRALADALA